MNGTRFVVRDNIVIPLSAAWGNDPRKTSDQLYSAELVCSEESLKQRCAMSVTADCVCRQFVSTTVPKFGGIRHSC